MKKHEDGTKRVKAVVRLEVPSWQIGQEVSLYFPDSMTAKAVCESDKGYVPPCRNCGNGISNWEPKEGE